MRGCVCVMWVRMEEGICVLVLTTSCVASNGERSKMQPQDGMKSGYSHFISLIFPTCSPSQNPIIHPSHPSLLISPPLLHSLPPTQPSLPYIIFRSPHPHPRNLRCVIHAPPLSAPRENLSPPQPSPWLKSTRYTARAEQTVSQNP